MYAVETAELCKSFGKVRALDGADLRVKSGELFGLLGVNGAGKTTLIRILAGLIRPTSGEAFLFGKSVKNEMGEIRRFIGISPQETSVAPKLTVRENLEFFASVYFADRQECKARVEEIVHTFSLNEVLERRAGRLSGGWQRRLSIAVALVSRPKLLFLDEPTLGLDVLARRELWKIIGNIKGETTVLLTSHYLEEIEALCDRIAVMRKGKIVAVGTTEQIKADSGESNFEDAFVRLVGEDMQ